MAARLVLFLLAVCLGPRSSLGVQVGSVFNATALAHVQAKKRATFYLGSDLAWASCTATYGGCLADGAIGGGKITLGGKEYDKGLLTHADSSAIFNLGGTYSRFIACLGISTTPNDPSCGNLAGEASFQVMVDGVLLYQKASQSFSDPETCINVDVTQRMQMELITGTLGSDTCDHTAWADAKVTTDDSIVFSYLGSDVPWNYCASDSAVGCVMDKAHASSTIVIGGATYPKGVAAHATSTMKFDLTGGGYTQFSTCYGITLHDTNSQCGTTLGLVTFVIRADGLELHNSGEKGSGSANCVKVDVTGFSELELYADKGSEGACDHAMWADAKLSSPAPAVTSSPTASPTASPTTASPTASPTAGGGEVAAIGDPHLTNVLGRKLELHRTGNLTLLQIPKAAAAAAAGEEPALPLLLVDALAVQKGPNCAQSYIESLSLTGQWVKDKYPEGTRYFSASSKFASPTHPRHKSYLQFGPGVQFVIIHGQTDSGISYLNFRATNLKKAGASIGGLLGDDGDDAATWAERLPEGCTGPHRKGTL